MLARLVPLVLLVSGHRAAQDPAWPEVAVRSSSGRFVAEIAKAAGQERVRDALARWRLAVLALAADGSRSELWSCAIAHGPEPRRHLLSDDATTFVQLVDRFPSRRPLVRVLREGSEVVAFDGDALGLELPRGSASRGPYEPAAWLEPDPDAARLEWRVTDAGAWLALVLRARATAAGAGPMPAVDLGTGELVRAGVEPDPVLVLPAPPRDPDLRLERCYVSALSAPPQALAGRPLELTVEGAYPTPNWNLMGFELARADVRLLGEGTLADEALERALEIVPRIAPPDRGPQAAVLAGFRSTAMIHGLGAGRWTIGARGRDERHVPPVVVEVLPARLRVQLLVTGGLAGVERAVRVYVPGIVERTGSDAAGRPSFAILRREAVARLEALLAELSSGFTEPGSSPNPAAGLGDEPGSVHPSAASDALTYQLGWWEDEGWRTLRADDGSAQGALRALIVELRDRD